MAHKILGIDIGSYTIKIVVATPGFRQLSIDDYIEETIPGGDEPHDERAAQALAELIRVRGFEHDVPCVAYSGDGLSLRLLEFGFQGLKRANLDKTVGAELEAQLPHDLDELVYDFEIIPPEALATDPTEGGRAPTPFAGTRVLAAATTRDRIERFLNILAERGVQPRNLLAAPTTYARIVEKLAAAGGVEARNDIVAVIDVGHGHTTVSVVRGGQVLFARMLSRGGKHVTQAIARAWNLPFEEAERAKHSDGFIASQREPAPSPSWQRISDVVKVEIAPLVRDLRQTLSACRAQLGLAPHRAVLCGGGSRLRGLTSHLGEELELPVGLVTADDAERIVGPGAAARGLHADTALIAHGAMLEGATGRRDPLFDLRKGSFAYRADYSFLRAKAGVLAACAMLIAAFGAANAYASLYKLRREEEVLTERLRITTTEIFGRPVPPAELASKFAPKKEASPFPKNTAFDQLVEIVKKMPPKDQATVDFTELDIAPQKVHVKAVADSVASIDAIEKRLKEIECFGEVQRGKVQGPEGKKEFALTIATKCM